MVEVMMPALSNAMIEGKVLCYLVQLNQHVTKGQAIAEVEADKANVEIESPIDGFVQEILATEGQVVAVNEPILRIVENTGNAAQEQHSPKATPLAKRLAQLHGLDLRQINGTGNQGEITKQDVTRLLDNAAASDTPRRLFPQLNKAMSFPFKSAASPTSLLETTLDILDAMASQFGSVISGTYYSASDLSDSTGILDSQKHCNKTTLQQAERLIFFISKLCPGSCEFQLSSTNQIAVIFYQMEAKEHYSQWTIELRTAATNPLHLETVMSFFSAIISHTEISEK